MRIALALLYTLIIGVNVWAGEMPFTLSAETITHDQVEQKIVALGNIEVVGGDGTLTAKTLTYDITKKMLLAEGNVKYVEKTGAVLEMNRFEISGDFKTGTLEALELKLGADGPKLTAHHAQRKDGILSLAEALYTPCKPYCAKDPSKVAWQLRAKKVAYNETKQQVEYENATLDVYGVPLLYTPYFRHQVGERKPEKGFINPRLGRSSIRGEEVQVSYYYPLTPSHDYTIRARTMTERGLLLKAEQRFMNKNISSEVKVSGIADQNKDTFRSDIDAAVEYVPRAGRRFGINAQAASDDGYLDDYFEQTRAFLPTTLYAEDASDDHYLSVYGTRYQDLRVGTDPATTAQILPRLQGEKIFALGGGEQFLVNGDILALHRDKGSRTRRAIFSGRYTKPWESTDGDMVTFAAHMRADTYHVEGTRDDGFAARLLPEASMDWERPYVSGTGRHVITPRAKFILSPRGGSNASKIPNEDSVAYEIDSTNLFDSSRFAGLDRVETGPRVVYGVDNNFGSPDSLTGRFFIGQARRLYEDASLPFSGGHATTTSDYVGFGEIVPTPWLAISSRFRLDNTDFETRRADTGLRLGDLRQSYLTATYTFLDGGPEEISSKGRYKITEQWALEGELRRDLLGNGKQLKSEVGLVFSHNCYEATFSAERRGYRTTNVPPSTEFMFNVQLLTFGRDDDAQ